MFIFRARKICSVKWVLLFILLKQCLINLKLQLFLIRGIQLISAPSYTCFLNLGI
uniref:Uncharacterized protein n=1 Tax=Rhizophora mucronata TaxID=61149 RepID=A0A2P2PCK6_RHIMU